MATSAGPSRFERRWAPLTIAVAGAAAYANSFAGPFVFDDLGSIAQNPSIRRLWPPGGVLRPPLGGLTVSGRPVLNLSLAFNYALSGNAVWSYHATNLVIHLLAGLCLYGLARRTPGCPGKLGEALAKSGRMDEAVEQFEAALRLKPDFAEAHNNLGNAWSGMPGRRAAAAAQIEAALRLRPDYPEAYNNLGNVWAATPGRLDDAVREYERALELRPDYAEAHFNLALALLREPGGADGAKTHLKAFLALRPDTPAARRLLDELERSSKM